MSENKMINNINSSKQWCSRCRKQHPMPQCEFIALPRSEGGHIPDYLYNYEEPCEHRKHISSGGKCYFCSNTNQK